MAECIKSLPSGRSCTIGRNTSADVLIRHESVSGKHCTLYNDNALTTNDRISHNVSCIITDHSSNGTWISPSGYPKSLYRLGKNENRKIDMGDTIMLLSPGHPDSKLFHFKLEMGIEFNEVVLCKVPISKRQRLSLKRPNTFTEDQIQSKRGKLTAEEEKIDLVIPATADIIPIATSIVIPPVPKRIITTTSPVTPVHTIEHHRPSLPRELSQEMCPKCSCLFNVIELIAHVDTCSPETKHCSVCSKLFPLTELARHTLECPMKPSYVHSLPGEEVNIIS